MPVTEYRGSRGRCGYALPGPPPDGFSRPGRPTRGSRSTAPGSQRLVPRHRPEGVVPHHFSRWMSRSTHSLKPAASAPTASDGALPPVLLRAQRDPCDWALHRRIPALDAHPQRPWVRNGVFAGPVWRYYRVDTAEVKAWCPPTSDGPSPQLRMRAAQGMRAWYGRPWRVIASTSGRFRHHSHLGAARCVPWISEVLCVVSNDAALRDALFVRLVAWC